MYLPTEKLDPVQREYQFQYWRKRFVFLIFLFAIAAVAYWRYVVEIPVDYVSDQDHFKYGSIGADTTAGGVPYRLWQILPEMFPEYLPNPQAFLAIPAEQRTAWTGYSQFGFIREEGHELPIGFSQRRQGIVLVGLNCAVCHTGTIKVTEGMDPNRIYDTEPMYVDKNKERIIIVGMPAHTVQLIRYFEFLFVCGNDARFTAENIMPRIEARSGIGIIEKFLYRSQVIPKAQQFLKRRDQQLDYVKCNPPDGPGRIDTFNPYKAIEFGFPRDGTIGTADFPSIWNQRPRQGMHLHWDGNNASVFERNVSASLGAGATSVSLDMPRMLRTATWLGAPAPYGSVEEEQIRKDRMNPVPHKQEMAIPQFPFTIDQVLAEKGEVLYKTNCAACHSFRGKYVGKIVPYDEIQTDRFRLDSYTLELSFNQNTLGAGQPWRFNSFRKTNGYANSPLDGLWARAPFLHNGSVPTLYDLLSVPAERPKTFYRGDDEYDPVKVGFRSNRSVDDYGHAMFAFDTNVDGNGNSGHLFGTSLSTEEKTSLIEYLKKL
jgi:hypothetical protein